jgi:hypothetical protein
MKYWKAMVLGAALVMGATTFAAAQAVISVQYNGDYNRQSFNDGYRQGKWDARHGQRFQPEKNNWQGRDDRYAYRQGYERGFNESGSYREQPVYGGGGYGASSARQIGYQDGVNDGQYDRSTGHSFRPTQGDNFKHADRGYAPNYGNKNFYKQSYRDAYQDGYSKGYNGNYYQRR